MKELYLSRAQELFKLYNLHSVARGHALVDFILQGHEQNESQAFNRFKNVLRDRDGKNRNIS